MPEYLALGSMPEDAEPGKWVAAGSWCFAGQEERFPAWEKSFAFAPEPLSDPALLAETAKAAQTLALDLIEPVSAMLDKNYDRYSPVYWEILLCPWTLALSRQIIERSQRVDALIKAYGDMKLQVDVLPFDCVFKFQDEEEFTLYGCLNPAWNHWLFSRLLEERWPKPWRRNLLKGVTFHFAQKKSPGKLPWKNRLKNILGRMQLQLPFPKLKGMSITQALRYSLALYHPCRNDDRSPDLKKEFYQPESLARFAIPSNLKEIAAKNIPLSLKNLNHEMKAKKVRKARLRIASIRAHEDVAYRQKLALWRESGNRLAFVQHGCNYGQVRVACDAPMLEYSQAVFFTWGWDKYSAAKGNFVPLPFPALQSLHKKPKGKYGKSLIYVGTEMAASAYRLDSRPTPLQFVEYRNSKADFFGLLPEEIKKASLYRPYFSVPGCLQDASWLLSRVGELKICTGNLWEHIRNCRLLVLDHPGTTMLEALAADIPMVLFWNRKHWPLAQECDKLLDELEKCGMWRPCAAMAVKMVESIWSDPLKWFLSDRVRKARDLCKNWQALVSAENADVMWIDKLKNI